MGGQNGLRPSSPPPLSFRHLRPPLLLIVLPSAPLIKLALMFPCPRCCIRHSPPHRCEEQHGTTRQQPLSLTTSNKCFLAMVQNSLLGFQHRVIKAAPPPPPHSKVSCTRLSIRQALGSWYRNAMAENQLIRHPRAAQPIVPSIGLLGGWGGARRV